MKATIENSYGCQISDDNWNQEDLDKFLAQDWKIVEEEQ